jgi:hypothetical protein
MSQFGLCHCLSEFGAAVEALIDEVDLRHVPMELNVSNVHGETYAAGTHNHSWLKFVVLDVGWHVGSPSQWKHSPLALDPKTTS